MREAKPSTNRCHCARLPPGSPKAPPRLPQGSLQASWDPELPGPAPRSPSVAPKTHDLSGRPFERLGAGLALGHARDHLWHDGLVIDLGCDCRWRRCAGDYHLLIALVGIVREGAFGWGLLVLGLDVIEFDEGRQIVALACVHQFRGGRARGHIGHQALGGRLVLGEVPQPLEARQRGNEARW